MNKVITIGIPQALMYYRFSTLWTEFFRAAGFQVVLSTRPQNGFFSEGKLPGIGDLCNPVRLFLAHSKNLVDKCDIIFIPRLISFDKTTYNCPHFMAIPDVFKAQCEHSVKILSPILDIKNRKKGEIRFFNEIADALNISKTTVKKARRYADEIFQHSLDNFPHNSKPLRFNQISSHKTNFVIGLVGRPYILYEPELGGKLLTFFNKEKIFLITPEMVSYKSKMLAVKGLTRPVYWYNGRENVATAYSLLNEKKIDGLVQIVTFGCGPDSLIKELIEIKANANLDIPYLSLVLDQNSSSEAVQTRLEAFLDMLKRKIHNSTFY